MFFKILATLYTRYRDRIAFIRICSVRFERNKFYHPVRLDKDLRFTNPATFMAQSKSIVEEAFPGDVIGLFGAITVAGGVARSAYSRRRG